MAYLIHWNGQFGISPFLDNPYRRIHQFYSDVQAALLQYDCALFSIGFGQTRNVGASGKSSVPLPFLKGQDGVVHLFIHLSAHTRSVCQLGWPFQVACNCARQAASLIVSSQRIPGLFSFGGSSSFGVSLIYCYIWIYIYMVYINDTPIIFIGVHTFIHVFPIENAILHWDFPACHGGLVKASTGSTCNMGPSRPTIAPATRDSLTWGSIMFHPIWHETLCSHREVMWSIWITSCLQFFTIAQVRLRKIWCTSILAMIQRKVNKSLAEEQSAKRALHTHLPGLKKAIRCPQGKDIENNWHQNLNRWYPDGNGNSETRSGDSASDLGTLAITTTSFARGKLSSHLRLSRSESM